MWWNSPPDWRRSRSVNWKEIGIQASHCAEGFVFPELCRGCGGESFIAGGFCREISMPIHPSMWVTSYSFLVLSETLGPVLMTSMTMRQLAQEIYSNSWPCSGIWRKNGIHALLAFACEMLLPCYKWSSGNHVPDKLLEIFNGKKKGSAFADPLAMKLSLLKSNWSL